MTGAATTSPGIPWKWVLRIVATVLALVLIAWMLHDDHLIS